MSIFKDVIMVLGLEKCHFWKWKVKNTHIKDTWLFTVFFSRLEIFKIKSWEIISVYILV